MRNLDCEVLASSKDGQLVSAGQTFFTVRGAAADLHAAWKVCLNVFDHLSAVATKTRSMVDEVHAVNPECEVLTTRKSMPGAKDLLTCAVMAGGAFPHRLGLSETVLVFEQHLAFFGGFSRFVEELPRIKARCVEKKLFVEADAKRAIALARASAGGHGVDGIQLDKVPVSELAELACRIREIDPRITIIAAGGINPQNAGAYAACGVDGCGDHGAIYCQARGYERSHEVIGVNIRKNASVIICGCERVSIGRLFRCFKHESRSPREPNRGHLESYVLQNSA